MATSLKKWNFSGPALWHVMLTFGAKDLANNEVFFCIVKAPVVHLAPSIPTQREGGKGPRSNSDFAS